MPEVNWGTCQFCGSADIAFELTPNLPHYGKETCRSCGRHSRWVPKPDSDKIRRPAAHKDLVSKYGNGYCEMCLILEERLPPGQTLEAQHVREYQHGGSEVRENIWIVCTRCHKLIHWLRVWSTAPGGTVEAINMEVA